MNTTIEKSNQVTAESTVDLSNKLAQLNNQRLELQRQERQVESELARLESEHQKTQKAELLAKINGLPAMFGQPDVKGVIRLVESTLGLSVTPITRLANPTIKRKKRLSRRRFHRLTPADRAKFLATVRTAKKKGLKPGEVCEMFHVSRARFYQVLNGLKAKSQRTAA